MGRTFLEVGEIRVECSGEGGGKTIWEEDKRGQCSGGADRGYSSKMGRGVRNIQDAMTTYQVLKFANCGILWYRFNGSYLNVVFWGSY